MAQPSPDSSTRSSPRESAPDGRSAPAPDQDALRQLALGFQAALRAVGTVPRSSTPPTELFNALSQRVRDYSAVARSRHIGPERVLVRVKTATSTLTASLPADVADALARIVLRGFLAGYYGEVAGRANGGHVQLVDGFGKRASPRD